MQKFYLAEIVTKDKLVHQGLYFEPKKKNKKALLWVHGLTDNFYGDMGIMEAFTPFFEKNDWGLLSLNTRGHDIVASIKQLDKTSKKGHTSVGGGSACEIFTDCVHDIDAGITFLQREGFSQVIIAGISTGANKVCYYQEQTSDHRVRAVILVSPISDVPYMQKQLGNVYKGTLTKISQIKASNTLLEGYGEMPITAQRFLSLYKSGGFEDTFPYYDKTIIPRSLQNIHIPLGVILGGADEYADRPVQDILSWFAMHQKSQNYRAMIIPGAYHSYVGKEKKFASVVVNWIHSL